MDRLNKLLAVATGIAGMVVYVYVLGGLVVWARLTAARLSTDGAVNALGNKSLLATGLKVVAFEFAVLALLSGLAWSPLATFQRQSEIIEREEIRDLFASAG